MCRSDFDLPHSHVPFVIPKNGVTGPRVVERSTLRSRSSSFMSATGGVIKYLYEFRFRPIDRGWKMLQDDAGERRRQGYTDSPGSPVVSLKAAIRMYAEGAGCGSETAVIVGTIIEFSNRRQNVLHGRMDAFRAAGALRPEIGHHESARAVGELPTPQDLGVAGTATPQSVQGFSLTRGTRGGQRF